MTDPTPTPPPEARPPVDAPSRRRRTIVRAVWIVATLGVVAFIVQGANRPADPTLEPAAGSAAGGSPLAGFEEVAFRITDGAGDVTDWCALLADSVEARARGLMHQEDLLGYDGMVFRFDGPSTGAFYMRNTLIPLSIAFFDDEGAFVSSADMEPCPDDVEDCPTHGAAAPYVHALEVPQGDLPDLGVGKGASISFPGGPCRRGDS